MAGDQSVAPQGPDPVEQGAEADPAVALHTGVGGGTGGVAGHEPVDHLDRELGGVIEDVVGHSETHRHLAGILGVGNGAAPCSRQAPIRGDPLLEGHADDLMPGLEHQRRGNTAVHTA